MRMSFRHVRTEENPADYATRGMTAAEMSNVNHIWYKGPKWLQRDVSEWPQERLPEEYMKIKNVESEEEVPHCLCSESLVEASAADTTLLMKHENFSSFDRLVYTMCRLIRGLKMLARKTKEKNSFHLSFQWNTITADVTQPFL